MKITKKHLRRLIKEELSRVLNERKHKPSRPGLGYHEDEQFHKFGVELDQDVYQVDAESAKTMAIDDALEGLRKKGVDVSGGHRVLRAGFSDGILIVGVSK